MKEISERPVAGNAPIPFAEAAVAAVALALGLAVIVAAKLLADRRRAARGESYRGCMASGCCSFHAMAAWSSGALLAAVFLLGAMLAIYFRIDPLVQARGTALLELKAAVSNVHLLPAHLRTSTASSTRSSTWPTRRTKPNRRSSRCRPTSWTS